MVQWLEWLWAKHNDLGSFPLLSIVLSLFGCKGGWEKPKEPVDLKLFCVAKLRLKLKMTLAVHLGVKTGLNRDSLGNKIIKNPKNLSDVYTP